MKKRFKKFAALALAVSTVVMGAVCPQTAKAETRDNRPIYRLYNPDNGEHLYTTDENERDTLYATYGWGYEGVAWYSANEGTPVYRLYNNVLCNHLYTTDLNEIRVLTSMDNTAWTVDNNNEPLFYSAGDVSIYRVYNEGLNGMHHLTTDRNEYDTLPTYGWAQEGVSLKAVAVGEPITTEYFEGRKERILAKLLATGADPYLERYKDDKSYVDGAIDQVIWIMDNYGYTEDQAIAVICDYRNKMDSGYYYFDHRNLDIDPNTTIDWTSHDIAINGPFYGTKGHTVWVHEMSMAWYETWVED